MIENLKNSLDFFLRERLKLSRKNFVEKNEKNLMRNYLENLYTFDILSTSFSTEKKHFARVLDIGSKNWFYAKGEHQFFESFCEDFELDGVEIDAHRLYTNLYSRYETSKFYTKNLPKTTYHCTDLLSINKKYDFIIWFLPFVTMAPLRYWGLPERLFMPKKLLSHAFSLLNEGGEMLIINQGEHEANAQKELFEQLEIKYEEKGIVKSDFLEYKNDRYAFLIKK